MGIMRLRLKETGQNSEDDDGAMKKKMMMTVIISKRSGSNAKTCQSQHCNPSASPWPAGLLVTKARILQAPVGYQSSGSARITWMSLPVLGETLPISPSLSYCDC